LYYSETAKVRSYVEKYCIGIGLDLGCGIDKIVPTAIGVDFPKQYQIDDHPETEADFKQSWEQFFAEHLDDLYDYIYSSHLLEDYKDPWGVLDIWLRFVKQGGFLILALPIEELYQKLGVNINARHTNNWKSAQDFCNQMPIDLRMQVELLEFSMEPVVDYNFYIVFRKIR